MNYTRKPEYVAYRKVSLRSATVPKEFREFTEHQRNISCTDEYVLEFKLQDGSTVIEGPYDPPKPVQYSIYDGRTVGVSKILVGIPKDVPVERLWIQPVGGGARYKVPSDLPSDEGRIYFYVSNEMNGMELVGDEYFDAAYTLVRGIVAKREG